MTKSQIVDFLLPYTKDEMRCGFKKKKKAMLRYELTLKINEMEEQGRNNEEILKYFQIDTNRAAVNMG